jgi:hypothetical protein
VGGGICDLMMLSKWLLNWRHWTKDLRRLLYLQKAVEKVEGDDEKRTKGRVKEGAMWVLSATGDADGNQMV